MDFDRLKKMPIEKQIIVLWEDKTINYASKEWKKWVFDNIDLLVPEPKSFKSMTEKDFAEFLKERRGIIYIIKDEKKLILKMSAKVAKQIYDSISRHVKEKS